MPRLDQHCVPFKHCVAWRSVPEHIHMVLSPPSSGEALAAPVAPRPGPGARGPREAPRGRRRCPRPGSPVPPWRGRRLCVRPGSPQSAPARGGLAALLISGRVSEARRTCGVGAHAGAGGSAEEEEERAGRAALRKEVEEAAGVLPPPRPPRRRRPGCSCKAGRQ